MIGFVVTLGMCVGCDWRVFRELASLLVMRERKWLGLVTNVMVGPWLVSRRCYAASGSGGRPGVCMM